MTQLGDNVAFGQKQFGCFVKRQSLENVRNGFDVLRLKCLFVIELKEHRLERVNLQFKSMLGSSGLQDLDAPTI